MNEMREFRQEIKSLVMKTGLKFEDGLHCKCATTEIHAATMRKWDEAFKRAET
jgi:hypothetical protein